MPKQNETDKIDGLVTKAISQTELGDLFYLRDYLQELTRYAVVKVMLPRAETLLSFINSELKKRAG